MLSEPPAAGKHTGCERAIRDGQFGPYAIDRSDSGRGLGLQTLWPRGRGGISHDSALELHELCDINPVKIYLTVPPQMRLRRRGAEPYVVHKEHLEPGQIILYEGIRVVSPEHAILQGIASGVPRQLLEQALDTARRVGKLSAETLVEVEEKQRGSS